MRRPVVRRLWRPGPPRGLVPSDDHAAVIAVRFENADRKGETLSADVVVDASGRGNLTCNLLDAIGLATPESPGVSFYPLARARGSACRRIRHAAH